jgi:undecaprenyl-diphosphatase
LTELLTVILLGIVEGITEFLPVSSTGHLILATRLLGYDAGRWEVFNVVIQLGAILAIVVLYWLFLRNLVVAFIPAAVIGLALHKYIEALLGNAEVVAIALIVGGFAILAVERFAPRSDISGVADIPLKTVIGIGFLQCLAMIPGVSRSGATILGALALGVERRTAAEFSFFLAIPTMLGASALELLKNRDAIASGGGVGLGAIAIGAAVSFIVALLVVKWFVGIVTKHGFVPFAWYRVAAGSAALVWLLTK